MTQSQQEIRIEAPEEIRALAATVRAKVWAYRESSSSAAWFKFKFGECSWSPPFTADEAIKYLQENGDDMAKNKKAKEWEMPAWLRRYEPLIVNTGGNDVTALMNGHETPLINVALSTLQACVKSQVALLERLHAEGLLKVGEGVITFAKVEGRNAIRSPNYTVRYDVQLDGRKVGAIKHKRGEGWRYWPRGGTPGAPFQDVTACMRSLQATEAP